MYTRPTKVTILRYSPYGLRPVRTVYHRYGKPSNTTIRRIQKRRSSTKGPDYRPIVWMCYSSLAAWCFVIGTRFFF